MPAPVSRCESSETSRADCTPCNTDGRKGIKAVKLCYDPLVLLLFALIETLLSHFRTRVTVTLIAVMMLYTSKYDERPLAVASVLVVITMMVMAIATISTMLMIMMLMMTMAMQVTTPIKAAATWNP